MGEVRKWRGKLPHIEVPGCAYFITSRLKKPDDTLNPSERTIVLDACLHWNGEGWRVIAAVVMPEHFHICVMPQPGKGSQSSISQLMKSIKGYSARAINLARGKRGTL